MLFFAFARHEFEDSAVDAIAFVCWSAIALTDKNVAKMGVTDSAFYFCSTAIGIWNDLNVL